MVGNHESESQNGNTAWENAMSDAPKYNPHHDGGSFMEMAMNNPQQFTETVENGGPDNSKPQSAFDMAMNSPQEFMQRVDDSRDQAPRVEVMEEALANAKNYAPTTEAAAADKPADEKFHMPEAMQKASDFVLETVTDTDINSEKERAEAKRKFYRAAGKKILAVAGAAAVAAAKTAVGF